ncbi:MAG: tetratricopeptide repeat protein [Smithellaceae bacterium]
MVILLAWVSVTLAGSVSEEAQRYMARGMAAVEMANTPKDYERAVREFEQAAKLAPNWPDVYFNLGSVQAKAGNYGEAMRHYKHYLELAPKASDAAKVREEIYKLEYRAEEKEQLRKERGRFSLEDGVIYDSQLGLEWAPSDGQVLNHYQAEGYARALSLAGGGWRLPTREELKSLYDKSKPGNVDPIFGVGDKWVWTSELWNEASIPGAVGFYFYDGGVKGGDRDNSKHQDNRRALAVRSGQSIVDSEKAAAASRIAAAYKTGYKGVRNYENGDKYEGEFRNRNLNGKGIYTYANGDKYVGEFVDGKFTSKGTFTCSNGKQFTGNLENKVPLEFTIRCN